MSLAVIKLIFLPALLAVASGTLFIFLGRPIRRGWALFLASMGVVVFAARALALVVSGSGNRIDLRVFWTVGRALLMGRDIYDASRPLELPLGCPYPPNAPPLCALLAILPWEACNWVFSVLSIGLALALAPLSAAALGATAQDRKHGLSTSEIFILGCTVALSPAVALILDVGQLTLVIGACLLAALAFKVRGRPILAGLSLAVAAIKPQTTLPFLLLFNRRSDIRTWLSLAVATAALCLLTGWPADWPRQFRFVIAEIQRTSQSGSMNDYMAEKPGNDLIIGFDYTLYRLGLTSRHLIRAIQVLAVSVIGAWLFWNIALRPRFSWGASCSLVALYSTLFFYHRVYDLVPLVSALVYAASRVRTGPRSARLWFSLTGLACLAALFVPGRLFKWVLSAHWGGLRGWALEALILPWATWAVLVAFGALLVAEHRLLAAEGAATPDERSSGGIMFPPST